MAADASTAAANPAGMTLLDRSQLLGGAGALLPSTNFDLAQQTQVRAVAAAEMRGVFFTLGSSFYGSRSGSGLAWRSFQIAASAVTT